MSVFKRCACTGTDGRQGWRDCADLRRSGHGTWAYRVDLGPGPDEHGVHRARRQRYKGGFATRKEAEAARAVLLAAARDGQVVDRSRLTVGEYLEEWLAAKVESGNLRPSSAWSYEHYVRSYLRPFIGHLRLSDLRVHHVEAAYAAVRAGNPERAKAKGRRAVGPTTQRRIHATLMSALNGAVKRRLIPLNPAVHAELPKASRPRVEPWSPAELGAFLDAAAQHELGVLFHVMAMTGLRRGEAIGLRWADIDLERQVLTVAQQIGEVSGRIVTGKPKTRSGEDRVVDLDGGTVGALLGHRLVQDTERATWGSAYEDLGLVFCKPGGSPLRPSQVTKTMQSIASAAGLPRKRLHDLRHGSASLQLAAGVSMTIVSKRLGHSSITITADTYSHLLEGVGRAAAEASAALVPRASVPAEQPADGRDVHRLCNDEAPEPDAPGGREDERAGQTGSDVVVRDGIEPPTLRFSVAPEQSQPLPDGPGEA